jgi:hypothetical protein
MDEWRCENVLLREVSLVDRLVTPDVNLSVACMRLEQCEDAEEVHWDQSKRLSGSGWLPMLALDQEVGEEMRGESGGQAFVLALGRTICALVT